MTIWILKVKLKVSKLAPSIHSSQILQIKVHFPLRYSHLDQPELCMSSKGQILTKSWKVTNFFAKKCQPQNEFFLVFLGNLTIICHGNSGKSRQVRIEGSTTPQKWPKRLFWPFLSLTANFETTWSKNEGPIGFKSYFPT